MKLTREQAIAEHRKMWNWIADETDRTGRKIGKREYMRKNDIEGQIGHDCFCCEYITQVTGVMYMPDIQCLQCPIDWGGDRDIPKFCMDSLFHEWLSAHNPKKAAQLARQIANLPERTDNMPVSK